MCLSYGSVHVRQPRMRQSRKLPCEKNIGLDIQHVLLIMIMYEAVGGCDIVFSDGLGIMTWICMLIFKSSGSW